MNLIIPMAGMGKRMRPHTLTTPKPLLKVAGKPIVQWLIEDIANVCDEKIDEIGFVIGDFGSEVEENLKQIAADVGAIGRIFHQEEALGTGHAILCAREVLRGEVIVAFADTLFRADFTLDRTKDGVIWVQKVDNPSSFGVVKYNDDEIITDFIEKPEEFVSDLAIIGIYYFKSGETLESELQYLIDNDIKDKGEFQITDAMENMKNKGMLFTPGAVDEWLDCGNYGVTVNTNQRVLVNKKQQFSIAEGRFDESVKIHEPCFIGEGVELKNCEIGPFVSVGNHSKLKNCVISNSIVGEYSELIRLHCENSMIGNHVCLEGSPKEYSIGDYSVMKQ
ncbi:MAG: sugar nucleotidyltransferase [Bacteroidia bacterium]